MCLCLVVQSIGEVKYSLPLQGYYRAGRFMPVAFTGGEGGTVKLAADGAVTTVIDSANDGIAPWLVWRDDVRTDLFGQPLHALSDDERLVGLVGDQVPADWFAGKSIVEIRLDSAEVLRGPVAAWQSLDGIVLDYPPSAKVTGALVAGGTSVAVRSGAEPRDGLPWRHDGDFWVAGSPSNLSMTPSDAVYDCVADWSAQSPPIFRRQVVLVAIVIAIGFLSLGLWRTKWRGDATHIGRGFNAGMGTAPTPALPRDSECRVAGEGEKHDAAVCDSENRGAEEGKNRGGTPWMGAAAVFLGAICAVGIVAWDRQHQYLSLATGDIGINASPLEINRWSFWRSQKQANLRLAWTGQGVALPALPEHDSPVIELHCLSDGTPAEWNCSLRKDQTIAFVFEELGSGAMPPTTPEVDSPLQGMIDAVYPRYKLIGQSPAGGANWPIIWLDPNFNSP